MINILYYLLNSNNKRISVIYTTNMMNSINMFTTNVDNTFNLKLNNSPNSFHEISLYNTFSFEGEIIDNVKDIDDFINRSSLLKAKPNKYLLMLKKLMILLIDQVYFKFQNLCVYINKILCYL
jgi:hypothetical protein